MAGKDTKTEEINQEKQENSSEEKSEDPKETKDGEGDIDIDKDVKDKDSEDKSNDEKANDSGEGGAPKDDETAKDGDTKKPDDKETKVKEETENNENGKEENDKEVNPDNENDEKNVDEDKDKEETENKENGEENNKDGKEENADENDKKNVDEGHENSEETQHDNGKEGEPEKKENENDTTEPNAGEDPATKVESEPTEDDEKPVKTKSRSSSRQGTPTELPPLRTGSGIGSASALTRKWEVNAKTLRFRPEIQAQYGDGSEQKYICVVCQELLRYPVRLECDHRCCSSCLMELLRLTAQKCPVDKTPLNKEKANVDKAFQEEMERLDVVCGNASLGCTWKGTYRDYLTDHVEEHTLIPCPEGCKAKIERRHLSAHLEDSCGKRTVTCEYCNLKMFSSEEDDHAGECGSMKIPCPNGCGVKDILRMKLNRHMEKTCPRQLVDCPFMRAGCDTKTPREDLNDHVMDQTESHIEMLKDLLNEQTRLINIQEDIREKQAKQVQVLQIKAKQTTSGEGGISAAGGGGVAHLIWKLDDYEKKRDMAKNGQQKTLFSPFFFTGEFGYKMMMQACLDGEGNCVGEYMSVFLCICKGDYDGLLPWPFSARVTFTMFDQNPDITKRKNIVHSVKPNTAVEQNAVFLGRPKKQRNASFGIMKFCLQSTLEDKEDKEANSSPCYVRDDVMFIKCELEVDDLKDI